jgi:diketogulonate reductase-like aldo/keto reductase
VSGPAGAKMAMKSAVSLKFPSYEEGIDLISASGTVDGAAKIVQLYRNVKRTASSSNETAIVPKSLAACQSATLPRITLGTMGLGKKTAQDVVSMARKLGLNAFDTAPTYKNEDKVGAGMSSSSDAAVFCIVKVPKRATTPEQVRQELNDSLTQLKRKSADLLLLHWPCDVIAANTLKDVWHDMEKLVQEGLAKNLGVCNFNAQALGMLQPHCIQYPPVVNQVERHPLCPQWELVDFCAKKDILLQAHTPLGQGKSDLLQHEVIRTIATQNNLSPAQVVLQWNLQQGVAVVPKCSTQEHMEQVLALTDAASKTTTPRLLSAADMEVLNNVSDKKRFVAPPFMYGKEPYCWGRQAPK